MRRADLAARMVLAAALLTAAGCGGSSDPERLADVDAVGGGATPPFYPDRAWTVRYAWDCKEQLAAGRSVRTGLELVVRNADDGSFVEENAKTRLDGESGRGTLTFTRPGAYTVVGSTECEMTLKIRQAPEGDA